MGNKNRIVLPLLMLSKMVAILKNSVAPVTIIDETGDSWVDYSLMVFTDSKALQEANGIAAQYGFVIQGVDKVCECEAEK